MKIRFLEKKNDIGLLILRLSVGVIGFWYIEVNYFRLEHKVVGLSSCSDCSSSAR